MGSGDGVVFLAQAAQQAPASAPRRISFVAGTRRVFNVAPGEAVVLDAQPFDLTYRRSGNAVLVTHANGAEMLLTGATPDGEPALVTIGDLTLPLLDIIATGLQAVAPAAGPIGLAGGNGQFRELKVDPLVGLSDTGPLGFSQPPRIVPDPTFTPGGLVDPGAPQVPGLVVSSRVLAKEDLVAGTVSLPIAVNAAGVGTIFFVQVSDLPAGVVLSTAGGALVPAGRSVLVPVADLASLRISGLPLDSDVDFTLSATPYGVAGLAGAPIAGTSPIRVVVDAVADVPSFAVSAASGDEDTAIALNFVAAPTDTDGSETITALRLSGVPSGSVLTHVAAGGATVTLSPTSSGGSEYALTPAQFNGLAITPPRDFNGQIVLGARIVTTETNLSGEEFDYTDNSQTRVRNITVDVAPVSDQPSLTLSVSGVELREDLGTDRLGVSTIANGGRAIAMTVTPGSPGEAAWAVISGIPAGVELRTSSGVVAQAAGSATVSQALLGSLSLSGLPTDSDVDFALTVTPWSRDGSAPAGSGAAQTLSVKVDAVVDDPVLGATLSGTEDNLVALSLAARLGDLDGSERIEGATISGLPAGYALLHVAGGVTTTIATSTGPSDSFAVSTAQAPNVFVRPADNANGTSTLGVTLSVAEQVGAETFMGDNTLSASGNLVLSIAAVSDTPSLSVVNVAGKEDFGAGPIASSSHGARDIPVTFAPGAPGESGWVVVSGIPVGMALSLGGTPLVVSGGAVTLPSVTSQTTYGLQVTSFPQDRAGDIVLTVTGYSKDGSAPAATRTVSTTVAVDAVGDIPDLSAPGKTLAEDSALAAGEQRIALSIVPTATDIDGSETVSVQVSGLAAGARLNVGTESGGVWTLTTAEAAVAHLVLPQHRSGDFDLTVVAVSREKVGLGGPETDLSDNQATRTVSQVVTVTAVADAPTLVVRGTAAGLEDNFIGLTISGALVDTDGSETLGYRLSGIPSGAVLRNASGTIAVGAGGEATLSATDIAGLQIRPPPDSNVDFTIGVTAIATETSNLDAASAASSIHVAITGVPDDATLVSNNALAENTLDAAGGTIACRSASSSATRTCPSDARSRRRRQRS